MTQPQLKSTSFADLLVQMNEPPETEPARFVVVVPKGSRWDDSHNCLLHLNNEHIATGTSRELIQRMAELGLQHVGRYFVQHRGKNKEIEVRLLTREQRAAGEKPIVAVRDLNEVSQR